MVHPANTIQSCLNESFRCLPLQEFYPIYIYYETGSKYRTGSSSLLRKSPPHLSSGWFNIISLLPSVSLRGMPLRERLYITAPRPPPTHLSLSRDISHEELRPRPPSHTAGARWAGQRTLPLEVWRGSGILSRERRTSSSDRVLSLKVNEFSKNKS